MKWLNWKLNRKLNWSWIGSRWFRPAFRLVVLVALVPTVFLGHRWWTGNRGVVVPGRVYRSSQLSGPALGEWIRRDGIRTVVNLRGPNDEFAWYRDEKSATLAAGATLIDLPLASDHWLSRAQAKTLIETLDGVEYPILIHCQWGAERTGMVASLIQLLEDGNGPEAAAREFSLYYLYVPTSDGRVMAGHARLYRKWLRQNGLDHSPERFRRWLLQEYEPRYPSREYWPYDPYPPVVISKPGPGREADSSSNPPATARGGSATTR